MNLNVNLSGKEHCELFKGAQGKQNNQAPLQIDKNLLIPKSISGNLPPRLTGRIDINPTPELNLADQILQKESAALPLIDPIALLLKQPEFEKAWQSLAPNDQLLVKEILAELPRDTQENITAFIKIIVELSIALPDVREYILQGLDAADLYQGAPLLDWINKNRNHPEIFDVLGHIQPTSEYSYSIVKVAFRCFKKGDAETALMLLKTDPENLEGLARLLRKTREVVWDKSREYSWAPMMEEWIKRDPDSFIPYRALVHFLWLEKHPSMEQDLAQLSAYQKKSIDIAEICRRQCETYPDLHPWFFHLVQKDPIALMHLEVLSKHLNSEDYSSFVRRYINAQEPMSVSEVPFRAYTSDDLIGFLTSNPTYLSNFCKLVSLERSLGHSLIPFFITPKARLEATALIDCLSKNPQFAGKFASFSSKALLHGSFSLLEAFQLLEGGFRRHPKQFQEIVELFGHNHTVCKFVLNSCLLPNVNLEEKLKQYRFLSANQMIEGLEKILLSNEILATTFLASPHSKRLFHLAASTDVETAEKLQKLLAAKEPLGECLINNATSATFSLIRKVLKLNSSDPHEKELLNALIRTPHGNPFSVEICGLLALHSQRNTFLFNQGIKIISTSLEKQSQVDLLLMEWISCGRFAMAEDLFRNSTTPFWKTILESEVKTRDDLDNSILQQLFNLHLSLQSIQKAPTGLSEQSILSLNKFALLIYKRFGSKEATEWIFALQLKLKYKPEQVKAMLESKIWQAMELSRGSGVNEKEGIDKVLETFKYKFPNAIIESAAIISAPSFDEFINSLCGSLITLEGNINLKMVEHFLLCFHLPDPLQDAHVKRILNALRDENYFSDRLRSTVVPPVDSRQYRAIQDALRVKSPLNKQHVCQAILSGLIHPLRQLDMIGSCFGTSVAIQQFSSLMGIKQSFEDFLSIATKGYVKRRASNPSNAFVTFPMAYEPENFKNIFSVNLFGRIREFTIANMSENYYNVFNGSMLKLDKALDVAVNGVALQLSAYGFDQSMLVQLKTDLHNQVRNHFCFRYVGSLQAPKNAPYPQGAWVLVDRATEESVVKTPLAWQYSVQALSKEMHRKFVVSPSGYTPMQVQGLKAFLPVIFNSMSDDKFIAETSGTSAKEIYAAKAPNMPHCPPFIDFGGAYTNETLSVYHATWVLPDLLPPHYHPLGRVLRYIESLPPHDKIEALRNPNLLKTFYVPKHGMNICIGKLLPLVMKAKGADALFEQWRKANENLLATSLTPTLSTEIIDKYFNISQLAFFKDAFIKSIAASAPKTIGELCKKITSFSIMLEGSKEGKSKAEYFLGDILSHIKGLSLPPKFDIVDTNWSGASILSFQISLDEQPSNFNWGWFNYPMETWEMPKITITSDEYSRQYA